MSEDGWAIRSPVENHCFRGTPQKGRVIVDRRGGQIKQRSLP